MVALEPLNGWAISLRLKALSSDVLRVSDGSLYPALHKLEQQGLIESEWRTTENNRRAKFYSPTKLGRKHLRAEVQSWDRLSGAITHLIHIRET
jgi:transcriptional regulator